MQPLEVLEKVNEFYNLAWEKLLYSLTAIITIVGVAVPMYIQYLQKKSLRLQESQILSDVKEQLSVLKQTLVNEIRDEYQPEIEKLKKVIKAERHRSAGSALYVQAITYAINKAYDQALLSYLRGLKSNLTGLNYYNSKAMIVNIVNGCLPNLTFEKIEEVFTELKESKAQYIENLIEIVSENGKEEFKDEIQKLNQAIEDKKKLV